jgi:hypothetical protein
MAQPQQTDDDAFSRLCFMPEGGSAQWGNICCITYTEGVRHQPAPRRRPCWSVSGNQNHQVPYAADAACAEPGLKRIVRLSVCFLVLRDASTYEISVSGTSSRQVRV